MATTSTIPAVKTALVSLLDAKLDVAVFYAWPGPNTPNECVFMGRYPDQPNEDRIEASSEVANVTAGRKQRDETYSAPVTIWSFRPDLSSDGAKAAEARAFVLLEALEDVLADDPTLGGIDGLRWARLGDFTASLHPFEKGRVAELIANVDVQARLK